MQIEMLKINAQREAARESNALAAHTNQQNNAAKMEAAKSKGAPQ
jgi:hypothetical protein